MLGMFIIRLHSLPGDLGLRRNVTGSIPWLWDTATVDKASRECRILCFRAVGLNVWDSVIDVCSGLYDVGKRSLMMIVPKLIRRPQCVAAMT